MDGGYILIVEWQGISTARREVRGPFATEADAWAWWRQQVGYPRGTSVRCERRIEAGTVAE